MRRACMFFAAALLMVFSAAAYAGDEGGATTKAPATNIEPGNTAVSKSASCNQTVGYVATSRPKCAKKCIMPKSDKDWQKTCRLNQDVGSGPAYRKNLIFQTIDGAGSVVGGVVGTVGGALTRLAGPPQLVDPNAKVPPVVGFVGDIAESGRRTVEASGLLVGEVWKGSTELATAWVMPDK
ncbi:MAG: hypothetical protein HQL11_02970 [Candidatus Omnitrophica bacterium]|nr:hypothetical protein [Candidatus Omnitrophota bacterium]